MRTTHTALATLGSAAILAVLGLTACNDHGTAPVSPLLSQAQAESLATTVVSDVAGEMTTATLDGSGSLTGALLAAGPATGTGSQCVPTKTPSPAADSDHDGVPDSVLVDYSGCVLSYPLEIDSLSGTIAIIDPTKLVADHAVERVFTDFKRVTVHLVSGVTTAVTDNGVRVASHDSTTLRSSETNFRTDYRYANGAAAEHVRTWESLFTADVAGSIQPNQLLPSGSWTVTGTSSWTRGQRSYSLTVTTNPALHYNAGCTAAPRFDAGKITAVVVKGSETITVTIAFPACGQVTVNRS